MSAADPNTQRTLDQVVEEIGVYPLEAYNFVRQGLNYTVHKVHRDRSDPEASHHVSGAQLCEGLREMALARWGMLAGTVLRRWNITSTLDFGRIVFALVQNGFLQKTDEDCIEDFRNVYDFRSALESGYRIECKA